MKRIYQFCLLSMFLSMSLTNISSAQSLWTKDASNPLPINGEQGSWNRYVFMPNVLYNSDSSRFEMWFTASNTNLRPYQIGFATSKDGVTWTVHPNPVLKPDDNAWDSATTEDAMVIRENGQYKMWYTGWKSSIEPAGIGYATSIDGIHWTKDNNNNPVIKHGSDSWNNGGPAWCSVLPVSGGGYNMWYTATPLPYDTTRIAHAFSTDGIMWVKDALFNPVLIPGVKGEWDDGWINTPSVISINDIYCIFYKSAKLTPERDDIGFAASLDGFNWEKDTLKNPALSPSSGEWDGDYIESPTIIVYGNTVHMWYDGVKKPVYNNLWQIGHATLPLDSLLKYATILNVDDKIEEKIPDRFGLYQNYPNPFNPSTNIEFTLPKSELTTLKVYNILGKEVSTLVSQKLNQGNHTYTFDGKNLASGIYYYQLVAGDFREVKKMILLR